MRIAVAVEADTGIVLPPEIAGYGPSDSEVVLAAAMAATSARKAIPSEFQVINSVHLRALTPLAKALGTRVKLVDSAPALEHAASALLAHLGA